MPELELSNDGNELSYTKKVELPTWITSRIVIPGDIAPATLPDVFETLKIKFYSQWDPVNFYIPQSF